MLREVCTAARGPGESLSGQSEDARLQLFLILEPLRLNFKLQGERDRLQGVGHVSTPWTGENRKT